MDEPFRLQVKFWGVRGSTPTPVQANLGYGGNTACIEVRLPNNEMIIIDGGLGVRNLGLSLLEEFPSQNLALQVFLTHFHWDHIQGLPFFPPLYNPANRISFHSFPQKEQIRETLTGQMTTPYFPVNFALLAAARDFIQIAREPIHYGNLCVRAFPLNHPQGACGYRIESNGAVVVIASDLEHGNPELDRVLRRYAEGADLLVYDAQYTPDEYPARKGWGHSTHVEGARVAREAGVKQLVLFHHDPSHTDTMLDSIVEDARANFENTCAAREGRSIYLS
ncbi:MAG: MBL fold metallo-hydrolase [Bryobacteraceae bacterium]